MNIRDALLEDKNFVTYTLAALVEVERDRIVSNGLATESQLSSLADVTEYMVKMAKSRRTDILVNSLANLCTLLKSIKLPGDFEKYTVDSPGELGEKFYIALDLPYDGDKFYDLSSILEGKKEHSEEEEENEEEEIIGMGRGGPQGSGPNPLCPHKHKDEEKKDKKEDECEDCTDDGENVQDILAEAVNNHLQKIAESLGDKGDHEAAYLVERTIRSIGREAEKGKLFGNK
jgi:hypothetical protein